MNLPLFRLPTSIEALDALIKKMEEQRAHLTPADSTPKETVPSDTTLNSPSKRTLKNLRLKSDRKRLIDDDGFQTPDKRHTTKKIGKKNASLPPTTSQTSNPTQFLPPPAESSDSEIEDEDAGESNPPAVGTPKNRFPPIFVNPPDNWCTFISRARQLAPTLISKLTVFRKSTKPRLTWGCPPPFIRHVHLWDLRIPLCRPRQSGWSFVSGAITVNDFPDPWDMLRKNSLAVFLFE
ncbi:hypothetical protein TNIN_448261 [Trichonephila inaurata madagascariensis]|uniref:Uncharacterized protein n=1 Tax=Trichonephila inaurata madagascariensis TaxID=2747483 RepID=A0A8X7CDQ4_9ARAC|nr:hypothetical protein TNIN_448261 [Trichonephila inaurata madagascariensis]